MRIILYSLFFLTTFSYTQTIKGVITLNPIKGIGDDTKLSEKAKKPMYYKYTFSNKTSEQRLVSSEGTTIDIKFSDENAPSETEHINKKPSTAVFYKNYNTNVFRYESMIKNEYLIEEYISIGDTLPQYNWALKNRTQTISGYLCKKATTTRKIGSRVQKITAWYSKDIVINDGPMDFNGLPGLILQIEIDDSSIVKFVELEILENKTLEIVEPENKTKMISIAESNKN